MAIRPMQSVKIIPQSVRWRQVDARLDVSAQWYRRWYVQPRGCAAVFYGASAIVGVNRIATPEHEQVKGWRARRF